MTLCSLCSSFLGALTLPDPGVSLPAAFYLLVPCIFLYVSFWVLSTHSLKTKRSCCSKATWKWKLRPLNYALIPSLSDYLTIHFGEGCPAMVTCEEQPGEVCSLLPQCGSGDWNQVSGLAASTFTWKAISTSPLDVFNFMNPQYSSKLLLSWAQCCHPEACWQVWQCGSPSVCLSLSAHQELSASHTLFLTAPGLRVHYTESVFTVVLWCMFLMLLGTSGAANMSLGKSHKGSLWVNHEANMCLTYERGQMSRFPFISWKAQNPYGK